MSDIPEAIPVDQAVISTRMATTRRDRLITTISAIIASFAIHAVIIFGGYVAWTSYVKPIVTGKQVLFAERLESPTMDQLPEIVDTPRPEITSKNPTAEVNMAPNTPSLDAPPTGNSDVTVPNVGENLTDLQPFTPGLGSDTAGGMFARPEELGGPMASGFGGGRGSGGGGVVGGTGNIESTGRVFGSRMAEGFKGKDVLLVWVVDGSASLYDKMEKLKGQVQPLFDSMNKENPKKLDMTVVSFEDKPQLLIQEPTADAAPVIKAFDAVKQTSFKKLTEKTLARIANPRATFPPTPLNTMLALRWAANPANLNCREDRQIVIALLTDEKGKDFATWQETLSALKARRIPLFVFGPTTRMVSETKPELLVVRDNSIAPFGVALVRGKGTLGSAEAVREPVCREWGAGMFGVNIEEPTEAGPFELSMLVKFTGGTYLIIDDIGAVDAAGAAVLPDNARNEANGILGDRQYNSSNRFTKEVMEGYLPTYDPEAIKALMASFGSRLLEIISTYEKVPKPGVYFGSSEDIKTALRQANDNLGAIARAINQVSQLRAGPEVPPRWVAHRDLFLAQLWYARYTMMEYVKALQEFEKVEFSTKPEADGSVRHFELRQVPITTRSSPLDMATAVASVKDEAGNMRILPVDIFTLEPMEAVIKSDQELQNFLKANSVLQGDNQRIPVVNFNPPPVVPPNPPIAPQMLIVATLGKVFSPFTRVEIVAVTQTKDELQIAVQKYVQQAAKDENTPYFPNHVVTVPMSPLPPKFMTSDKWIELRATEEAGLLKGGKESARCRQEAKIAISRVIRLYKGMPWEHVAAQMAPLNSVKLEEIKAKPQAPPATPSVPGVPGDF
jgi:hypothetical protein